MQFRLDQFTASSVARQETVRNKSDAERPEGRQFRRKSEFKRLKNRFLGSFSVFCDPKCLCFDRKPLICFPYLDLLQNLMTIAKIRDSLQLPTVSRHNATVSCRNATILCHLRALLCHLATFLCTFVQRREFRLTSDRVSLLDRWRFAWVSAELEVFKNIARYRTDSGATL